MPANAHLGKAGQALAARRATASTPAPSNSCGRSVRRTWRFLGSQRGDPLLSMRCSPALLFDGAGSLSRISCLCKTRCRLLREMLRHSRRSLIKRCKRGTFDVRGRLDRTQEVAGSSPASSMKDLQKQVSRFPYRRRRAPGRKQAARRPTYVVSEIPLQNRQAAKSLPCLEVRSTDRMLGDLRPRIQARRAPRGQTPAVESRTVAA